MGDYKTQGGDRTYKEKRVWFPLLRSDTANFSTSVTS